MKPQGPRARRLGAPWGPRPSKRASEVQKMEPGVPKMTLDLGTDVGADVGTRIGPDFLRFSAMLGASRSPDDLHLDM